MLITTNIIAVIDSSKIGWEAVLQNRKKASCCVYVMIKFELIPPRCWIYLPAGYVPLNYNTLQSS